jgi:hypothetical protein
MTYIPSRSCPTALEDVIPHSAEPVSTNTTVLNFALPYAKTQEKAQKVYLPPILEALLYRGHGTHYKYKIIGRMTYLT